MDIQDIIEKLQQLEDQILDLQDQNTSIEYVTPQNETLARDVIDLTPIQYELDSILEALVTYPQSDREKAAPYLQNFQRSVQGYYDAIMKDVTRLQGQIGNLKQHTKAVKIYATYPSHSKKSRG